MSFADEAAATERRLMERHGGRVEFRHMGGHPAPVTARFEQRPSEIGSGDRTPRQVLWSVMLATEPALRPPDAPDNPLPPVEGDEFLRPHGPRVLRIVSGGYSVEDAAGRAVAYHNPVMEI